jgi:cysteinyl-tRNA synthetase
MAFELKLYDTLTRDKRVFTPIDPANVRMYVCGPTVYDFAHIGNARPVIVFDVLYRLLRHIYGPDHVTYVRNITDVDDKINARAVRDYPGVDLNQAIRKVTEATEAQFQADVKALGCLPPTHQPRATEFVLPRSDGREDMKSLIQALLDRRNAYVAIGTEGKEVLFDVASMSDYGALSGRNLEDQKAGARIAVDAHKKNPGDFVLWKESGDKEPGWNGKFEFMPDPKSGYEAEFTISPENALELGLNSRVVTIHGRPGWHIECSAMSAAYLGKVFDIHGGGLDLIFPHHENEIAQSRCAHDTTAMANYWMHNGFLQVEGEKMSKSLGNFVTIRELLRGWKGQPWSGDCIRWAMLQTHYRQPIDWTFDNLLAARRELGEFYRHFRLMDYSFNERGENIISAAGENLTPSFGVVDALCDDLNLPEVLSCVRSYKSKLKDESVAMQALRDLMFLGVVSEETRYVFSMSATGNDWPVGSAAVIGGLIYDFRISKANRDSSFADDIFDKARQLGISIEERGPLSINLKFHGMPGDTIKDRIEARNAARAAKDFKESDRIRDELAAMGVVLKDSKEGTTWEIAR